MRLVSLKIEPRGQSGWGSKELIFAKNVTQLYGPNGTGKTPLLKALSFCLGYPSVFRNDILDQCKTAKLVVEIEKKHYLFQRAFTDEFDIEVTEPTGTKQTFYNEADISKYILELNNYQTPKLVSVRGEPAIAYVATFLPIFYLDQDYGYDDFYKAPSSFIQDQFEEMVRISGAFPSKNPFDQKKHRINAKSEVERKRKSLFRLKKMYEDSVQETKPNQLNIQNIEKQIGILKQEVESLKSTKSMKANSTNSIDKLISLKMQKIRQSEWELNDLEKKCESFDSIKHEIETEINTLSLNEESRRIFMSFNEICSVNGCGLFLGSTESYGKNLLYLRDQIKDLELNQEASKIKIGILKGNIEAFKLDLHSLTEEREKLLEPDDNGFDSVVDTIHKCLSEIISLEIMKKEQENLNELEELYLKAEHELNIAINAEEALSKKKSKSSIELIKFKASLKSSIIDWLKAIKINNVSTDITIKANFKPDFGHEKLKQLSGSTHLRAILSFHAALFEQLIEKNKFGFKFLILDTPGQHDISESDLDSYIKKLKRLAKANNIQLVFSATKYKYQTDTDDIIWQPSFDSEEFEQTMFLGYL